MVAGPGQGGGGLQSLAVNRAAQFRAAPGQGSGLVEHHPVDGCQAFQGGAAFDKDSGPHQAPRGDYLDHRHGQAQGAGTGDNKHGDGNHQGLLPDQPRQQPPAEKGQQSQCMHHRGVISRHPVGDGDKTRPALFGGFHQAHDIGQQGIVADRRHFNGQRRA